MGIAARRLHRQRHYGELAELSLTLVVIAKLRQRGLTTRELVLVEAKRERLHLHGFNPIEVEAIRLAVGLPKSGSPAA